MVSRPHLLLTIVAILMGMPGGGCLAGIDDPIGLDHSPKVGRDGAPLPEHELLEQIKRRTLVPLKALFTEVDVNADGVPDMVVRSWRKGGVPPASDVTYDFFIRREGVFGGIEFHSAHFHRGGSPGGDGDDECMRSDVRLLVGEPGSGEGPTLIEAYREVVGGRSLKDPAPVMFIFHHLQNYAQLYSYNYYFVEDGKIMAKKEYCDVGDAFEEELGLAQPRNTLFPSRQ